MAVFLGSLAALAESSDGLRAVFADPPREYSSSPLWVWNDLLTEEQIVATMRDLASQQVKQVFVHPRPGLMTTYLSEDWFRLWNAALREAEALDMNVWIYDENSYPSGFAGGYVPKAMPESHGLGLKVEPTTTPVWTEQTVAVYRLKDGQTENVTAAVKSGGKVPDGDYLTATIVESASSPWFGGTFYVDLLRPGVTEKFLEITLEAYRGAIGSQFGKRVPGSFTDEPHLAPAGGLHWTPDLPEQFEQRFGYSLLDHLPSLVMSVGDWKKVRHDYHKVLLELFIERWAKPYYEYCERNGLEFTGHYWEHEWPRSGHGPDNMAMYAWHQRPAIDTLFNQYDEGPHAQFGNVRAVLELTSASNQMGWKRNLCEAYGGGGWDLRFEDMKRIGEWLYVLGVNTLDEHLSYISARGARKYDYPQSFSYHEPWWDSYHVMARRFTRLSAALSHGRPVPRVLLIEPTTTAWMYEGKETREQLEQLGAAFQKLVTDLAKAQVEFDLGSEDILARHGSVNNGALRVGKREYAVVVLPPQMETIGGKTVELLEQCVESGGVLCVDAPELARVDGAESGRGRALRDKAAAVPSGELIEKLRAVDPRFSATVRQSDGSAIVYHLRKSFEDGELVFVVNVRNDAPAEVDVACAAACAERWDLDSGAVSALPVVIDGDTARATLSLPPCGSELLFFATSGKADPAPAVSTKETAIAPKTDLRAERIAPNVLTLDYLDLTINGETAKNLYMYEAARRAFQSVGLPENPWDHAVQFSNELVAKQLPPNTGFEATYRFAIDGAVPAGLRAVVERPDLYEITCNGAPVRAIEGEWWFDRAFGVLDIAAAARSGENTLTLKTSAMTMMHEIAAVYVLGDFGLRAEEKGFAIVPPKPLSLGPWNAQELPLYAAGVSYAQEFEIANAQGAFVVRAPEWYGSVAKVIVNGELAGHIGWQPFECDVTRWIKSGNNRVELIVVGTLKNTLGPHHNNPPLGIASPHSFRKAPENGPPAGTAYHTVGYGLMKPFALVQRTPTSASTN